MNPNDEIRRQILRWFYDRNANATSQYGKKGSASKVSDAKKGLKNAHGLTQSQVMSNLTYLLDKGWVNKTDIEKTVRTKKGTVPSTVSWYEISAAGIDRIEGESEFQFNPRFAGVNIQATGSNIITLGDGNIVNADYETLYRELEKVKTATAESDQLNDAEKLDALVDIESIRDQLAKPTPDRTIIGHLWARIEEVATMGGFLQTVQAIAPLIGSLIG